MLCGSGLRTVAFGHHMIAIGDHIGTSGARGLVTLLHQMQKRGAKKSLVTLCSGGGMEIAVYVER